MSSDTPRASGPDRSLPVLTVLFLAGDEAQRGLALAVAAAFSHCLTIRLRTTDQAIGRDLVEASRVLALDWRVFDAVPHLRELLLQRRGLTTVVVQDDDPAAGSSMVHCLRRHAGGVLATGPRGTAELRRDLLAPVVELRPETRLEQIADALQRTPVDTDRVDSLLCEAQAWLQRGAAHNAFFCASRALRRDPDQPRVVADVARLLASMGHGEQAQACCRAYLLQRPDSVPVRAALAELQQQPA